MKFLSRRIVMPSDLNSRGSLFGGRLMAWIDEDASVYAALGKEFLTRRPPCGLGLPQGGQQ